MKKVMQVVLLSVLFIVLLSFVNANFNDGYLVFAKTVAMLSIIMFIPGYLFTRLLFGRRLESAEVLILSVFVSVVLVVLVGIAVDISGLFIGTESILSLILSVIFVLTLKDMLKGNLQLSGLDLKRIFKDRIFYVNMVVLLAVILVAAWVSMNFQPKEEFVEVSWKISKVENITTVEEANCRLEICSLSGLNNLGSVDIGGHAFNVLLIDINEPAKYDSICLDIDKNGAYCDQGEGPFWPSDSFIIGGKAFSFNMLRDGGMAIFNYPKRIGSGNFTVSYVVKSHYSTTLDYGLVFSINKTAISEKNVTLAPGEELQIDQDVVLPDNGLYKVEATVLPKGAATNASVSFFVTY